MGKIEFIEETHTYLLDGVIIPSVSEIISDDTYASIPPHILEVARDRGTNVHLATEMIDKGKKPKLDSTFAEWVVQYMLYKWKHQPVIDEIETIVHTKDYAGTIDRIEEAIYKTIIIDIKTTSKLYKEKIALQLGAYAYAHCEMNKNKNGRPIEDYMGAVIWLKKDSWQYVEIEPNVDGFLEKLEEWKSRQDNEIEL